MANAIKAYASAFGNDINGIGITADSEISCYICLHLIRIFIMIVTMEDKVLLMQLFICLESAAEIFRKF